jgi:hypothetical protein
VVEALDALPKNARTPDKPASQLLALIARLYAVESYAQSNNLSTSEHHHYRQEHSVAVLGQIQALVLAHLHSVMPGSSLGKALHYLSAQWPKLSRYVEDGRYPIDNNPCHAASGMTRVVTAARNAGHVRAGACVPERAGADDPASRTRDEGLFFRQGSPLSPRCAVGASGILSCPFVPGVRRFQYLKRRFALPRLPPRVSPTQGNDSGTHIGSANG